ncbi:MAG: radical SAM/SPASM domain-containing protein [Candidatus Omnitrophica bacterium]|nr:radical SAM/SPASM domain-containing protein [Candidatus Omnitrophota bacterium]
MNWNRRLDRSYIPDPFHTLTVETSSLCNLNCRFCAYGKKAQPRTSMSNEFFFDVIEQAAQMGFRRFALTPLTGDVFMDKHFLEKTRHLDNHKSAQSYSFFTNFVIPNEEEILQLLQLKKLNELVLSIYGHDEESFIRLTRSNAASYRRLLNNLETLIEHFPSRHACIEIGWRTYSHPAIQPNSRLIELMQILRRKHRVQIRRSRIYNNWGGSITPEDVKGLDIQLGDERRVYKQGACSLIFYRWLVMADGIVNACACRDVDATLRIGDLRTTPLKEILSTRNGAYMALIQKQQAGHFDPVCRDCDFYKSIYRYRSSYSKHQSATMRLPDFLNKLDNS